jgi:hypothetical protein
MANSANKRLSAGEAPEGDVRRYIAELRQAPPRETMISGMVKSAEGKDGLLFAHTGDCEHWVFIATSAIQTVKTTGRVQCGGHSYNLAEIQLKTPQSDLEKAFALVGDLHWAKLARSMVSAPANGPCPKGTKPVFDDWGNLIRCE